MKFLFSVLLILTTHLAGAEPLSPREVSFEWEPTPGATRYDVIIRSSNKSEKPLKFKTTDTAWKGQLVPGEYELKFRSVDSRSVVGDWSPAIELVVQLRKSKLVSPVAIEINGTEEKTEKVEFKWEAVEGAKEYQVTVFNDSDSELETEKTDDLSIKIEVPVAQVLHWQVTALHDKKNIQSTTAKERFVVLGTPIEAPSIEIPESKFVTELEWAKAKNATSYTYLLERKTAKGWKKLEEKTDFTDTEIDVNPRYPGGDYRFQVWAKAPLRKPSAPASIEFKVYEGLRTPAAIEVAKLKEAIEKDYSNFFMGSYLISGIDYSGVKNERAQTAKFNALGGTGRIGGGRFLQKAKWGFSWLSDMSGINFKSGNHIYFNSEGQIVHRAYFKDIIQLRSYVGLFYRQLPESFTNTAGEAQVENLSFAGPQGGFQLWYPFTYKLGIQVNGQVLMGMMGVDMPDGGTLQPSLSYQFGVLGSYKVSQKITGFAGYAYRNDSVSYNAKPFDGTDLDNLADAGDINKVSLTGHYLNLFLEWGF